MKCLLLLLVAVAVYAANTVKNLPNDYAQPCHMEIVESIPQNYTYKEGDRYIYVAGDGDDKVLYKVDTRGDPIDYKFIGSFLFPKKYNDAISFWLFTRANPETVQILEFGELQTVINSNYNSSKSTVFLSHGWKGHGWTHSVVVLIRSFLYNDDCNVIVIDWRSLANTCYFTAKASVPVVGTVLGRMVRWLVSLGLPYNNVHLVGFSLGGHVVGQAGKENAGQVRRITALDPAGPWWYGDPNRILSTDAQYVEVIHTQTGNGYGLGYFYPCGDADFFPNGGNVMPGCYRVYPPCSHYRAYEYMSSSLRHKDRFMAYQCGGMWEINHNRCTGKRVPMGNSDLSKNVTGFFRVNTRSRWPF